MKESFWNSHSWFIHVRVHAQLCFDPTKDLQGPLQTSPERSLGSTANSFTQHQLHDQILIYYMFFSFDLWRVKKYPLVIMFL